MVFHDWGYNLPTQPWLCMYTKLDTRYDLMLKRFINVLFYFFLLTSDWNWNWEFRKCSNSTQTCCISKIIYICDFCSCCQHTVTISSSFWLFFDSFVQMQCCEAWRLLKSIPAQPLWACVWAVCYFRCLLHSSPRCFVACGVEQRVQRSHPEARPGTVRKDCCVIGLAFERHVA